MKAELDRPINNAYLFGIFTDRELSLTEYEKARKAAVDAIKDDEGTVRSLCDPVYVELTTPCEISVEIKEK